MNKAEENMDIAAFAAEIGDELRGGEDAGHGEPASTPAGVTKPAPAPVTGPGPAPGPAPAQAPPAMRPLPKAWKKEMEDRWKTLPPDLHDYIYDREADVSRGFQMYRDSHENWTSLLQPYQQVLQQYPDVKPRELLNSLLQTHLALTFGTPEQQQAIIQHLAKSYNLPAGAAPASDQAVQALAGVQSRLDRIEQENQQAQYNQHLSRVNSFFSDKKNEHANEIADDILAFVQKGFPLETAYEYAVWTNPKTRAKMLAKQAAPAPSAAALNVRSNAATPPPPAPRKGQSLDATVDAISSAIFARAEARH